MLLEHTGLIFSVPVVLVDQVAVMELTRQVALVQMAVYMVVELVDKVVQAHGILEQVVGVLFVLSGQVILV